MKFFCIWGSYDWYNEFAMRVICGDVVNWEQSWASQVRLFWSYESPCKKECPLKAI